jgi:60 kDa SS-A/Ro ribonucleoprotein
VANIYASYAQHVTVTPQSQPIPGRELEMVANNAGGYGFVLDDWERLMRWLVIGSEGGTYYVGEQKLTAENAAAAIRCIKTDGPRAVEMARDVNVRNRAPKTDQQLFVLALAMKHGDAATKAAVAAAVPQMVRIGTHLLHLVGMLDGLGGWNRSKRRIIANWFVERGADSVAFQMLKYQNRDSWCMRDVLRLTHPKAPSEAHDAAFAWATGKLSESNARSLPAVLQDHQNMLVMSGTPTERALWGIAHNLPREALPTEAVNTPEVQRALLPHMPIHALIRNLGNLTASGVLADNDAAETVAGKIVDKDALRKSRVHPFAILLASLVYRTGKGVKGSKTWLPVPAVLAALEDAYDLAFDNVTPTGKRMLIGIDISGSMTSDCMGTPVQASVAAAAMAITLGRMEPNAIVVQFDTAVQAIVPVTKRTSILSLQNTASGGTDVGSPILWALGERVQAAYSRTWGGGFAHVGNQARQLEPRRQPLDAIVILTDNETWSGNAHACELLARYRREINQQTRLVCCAMTASHANIVDPQDPLQFGTAGLDANLPSLVADFIAR